MEVFDEMGRFPGIGRIIVTLGILTELSRVNNGNYYRNGQNATGGGGGASGRCSIKGQKQEGRRSFGVS